MNLIFKYLILGGFLISLLAACSTPKARKPITKTHSNFLKASIKRNKLINQQEEAFFKNWREKDTIHQYIDSKHGFYYFIKSKNDSIGQLPKKGDEVVLNYEIRSINGEIILPKEKLGSYGQKNKADRLYKVDGENFIQGVQDAV
ncbi:MAG TPA: hypothetical protein ENK67_01745, partial [Flavobacteriia bacterium]|nr:hypothetical protein [Flavobacteriia bacterium]